MEKIVVSVIGNQNAGKSFTWNTLFGKIVRTGAYERSLYFNDCEYTNVFLISGSPEERETYVGDIMPVEEPKIVLCSMQYRDDVKETIDYFVQNGYGIYTQWLNPGYEDSLEYNDYMNIISYLLDKNCVLSKRNGKKSADGRVRELRDFLYGWAKSRNLVEID